MAVHEEEISCLIDGYRREWLFMVGIFPVLIDGYLGGSGCL